jgi:hypothetical protein
MMTEFKPPISTAASLCLADLLRAMRSAGSVVCAVARCAEKVAFVFDRISGVLRSANQLYAASTAAYLHRPTQGISAVRNLSNGEEF